jgi:hypothetical protein
MLLLRSAGLWIESFVRLKNNSILSDDLAQQLTDLVRDQLAYSIPLFGDPAKKTLTPRMNFSVSYQMRSLSTIKQRMPLLLGNLLDRIPA